MIEVRYQKALCWKENKITKHRVQEFDPKPLANGVFRRESLWTCLSCELKKPSNVTGLRKLTKKEMW